MNRGIWGIGNWPIIHPVTQIEAPWLPVACGITSHVSYSFYLIDFVFFYFNILHVYLK